MGVVWKFLRASLCIVLFAPRGSELVMAAPNASVPRNVTSSETLSTEELRDLQAKLNQKQFLSVRFVQTRVSSLRPKKPSTTSGKAIFARPAKFRWEFEKPAADVLLFDGHTLLNYKPGESTATKFNAEAERAREIKEVIDFVLDFDALLGRYSIKEATRNGDIIAMTLTPKSTSALSELEIEVDAKKYFVCTINMKFHNKNRSEFKFSEPVTTSISPEAFQLPAGLRVVEGV